MVYRHILLLGLLLAVVGVGFARAQEQGETPGALPNPGSYQGSMQLQREEQQRDMQMQQQNQAMQQRLDQNYRAYAPGSRMGAGGGAPAVNWFAKPALPPDKNPLLGRWRQTGSRAPRVAGALGQLSNGFLAGAMAGGCQSMFGKGVIAFEPNALQWVAPDGHEEILNHVGYRANGNDVVMVTRDPGAVPALFFGFPNHDHAVVAVFGCTMERLGARPGPASSPPAQANMRLASAAPPAHGETRLNFLVGAAAPGRFAPLAGVKIWVTRRDPTMSLMRANIPVRGDLETEIDSDCHDLTACMRDWKAMTSGALGFITSDGGGRALTPVMAPGRYFLVGVAPYQGKHLFWHHPFDVRAGSNAVTLDQTNASIIH